jgi:serine O-acetyltransferase
MNLREYLDADWNRLSTLSSPQPRGRRMSDVLHPRFAPVAILRCAQTLNARGWGRLSRLFSLLNVILFGLEVPATLAIGPGLIITHTNGIVLGAGAIGSNATIYQQVTIGALEADFRFDPLLRPVIEDNVVLAAGAKILGTVRVGSGSTVGANAVVLADVPPGHIAVGVPARVQPKASQQGSN